MELIGMQDEEALHVQAEQEQVDVYDLMEGVKE